MYKAVKDDKIIGIRLWSSNGVNTPKPCFCVATSVIARSVSDEAISIIGWDCFASTRGSQ
jgi:hypothetical protein